MRDKRQELDIRDLGIHGEGIGEVDGKVTFVDGALPGERVQVFPYLEKKSYCKATLISVISKSKDRVVAPCSHFESCGGCQLMHLSQSGQLEYKRAHVQETLRRLGAIAIEVEPCSPSPLQNHYRNKIVLPIGKVIGLYARGSHDIIDIDGCLIHNEVGEGVFKEVKELILKSGLSYYDEKTKKGELRHLLIRTAMHSNEVLIGLITSAKTSQGLQMLADQICEINNVMGVVHGINLREDNVILPQHFKILAGRDYLIENLCNLQFKMTAGSFFQVNPKQAEKLYQTALEWAQVAKGDVIVDAYCGVGTISLVFAREGEYVYGIEIVPEAIANAKANAALNQIENVEFSCGKAEELISKIGRADVVILNPPRKGCERQLLEQVIRLEPRTLIYISCHPATLARDLAILSQHGYVVDRVKPFDMFPQTTHVETLACLIKNQ